MSFYYKNNILFCEDVNLLDIVKNLNTPIYIYSKTQIENRINELKDAFSNVNLLICYALKANSNLQILKIFSKNNYGADIVSGGEFYRAIKSNFSPQKIVFSGVGKSEDEIIYALKKNILMFNVESIEEIKFLNDIASRLKKIAPVAIRINPDIDVSTHHYIKTGKPTTKFGITLDALPLAIKSLKNSKNLKLIGLHIHIGSQIKNVQPYIKLLKLLFRIEEKLKPIFPTLKYLDLGGGFGIEYSESDFVASSKALAKKLVPLMKSKPYLNYIIEPGRYLIGKSGVLVTKVLFRKISGTKRFIVVDAGMNDFIRPALYNAYHRILPLQKNKRKKNYFDIVGPVCESGDFFAKDRLLSQFKGGEFIAIMDTGAYGFVMSSQYNSRPRPPEVLVEKNRYFIIRKRENYKDLIRLEI